MIKEIYLYLNGCLLSRRYILSETGVPLTRSDVTGITVKVFKLVLDEMSGEYIRILLQTITPAINDVIPTAPVTDVNGKLYNFRYCVENIFTLPNTRYLVEYDVATTDSHHIIFNAKGRTLE